LLFVSDFATKKQILLQMYCYSLKLVVYSRLENYTATFEKNFESKTLTGIIQIYQETVYDAIHDSDFDVISTSLQESLKD